MSLSRTVAPLIGFALAVAGLASPNAWADDWRAHAVTDHLRSNVGIGTTSVGEIEDGFGKLAAELTVSCVGNTTTVEVDTKIAYFRGYDVQVEYALNGGSGQRALWNVCAGGNCAGLWDNSGIPFLKSLFGKSVLRVNLLRRAGATIVATFPIAGAKEAFGPLGKSCGWIP